MNVFFETRSRAWIYVCYCVYVCVHACVMVGPCRRTVPLSKRHPELLARPRRLDKVVHARRGTGSWPVGDPHFSSPLNRGFPARRCTVSCSA